MKSNNFSITKRLLTVAFVSVVGILSYFSYQKIGQNKQAESAIQVLPKFELTDIFSNFPINHGNILSDKYTLLVFFNSHCDYCGYELEILNNARDLLIDTNVVLFSAEHPDSVRQFISEYNFAECENIFMGRGNYQNLVNWFGKLSAPTSFVYDKNMKLVKKFIGLRNIDVLLETLEKGNTKDEYNHY